MGNQWEGVGVTARELTADTVVMVPVGQANTMVNGGPCVIAWAVVRGPADDRAPGDPQGRWWLEVYLAPGAAPLPQMYRAEEILGVPALGLHMDTLGLHSDGAPTRP